MLFLFLFAWRISIPRFFPFILSFFAYKNLSTENYFSCLSSLYLFHLFKKQYLKDSEQFWSRSHCFFDNFFYFWQFLLISFTFTFELYCLQHHQFLLQILLHQKNLIHPLSSRSLSFLWQSSKNST